MGPAVQHRRHAHNTLGSRALAAEFLLNLFTVFVFIATGKASRKSSTTICQPARGKNNLHVSIYKYLYIYLYVYISIYITTEKHQLAGLKEANAMPPCS